MGYNRSPCLFELVRREPANRNRYHILHYHPKEDLILYCESYTANSSYFISLRARILSTGRGWRESDPGNQYSPVTGCVPFARIENLASYIACTTSDSQISPFHVHNEHGQYSRHCHHHQLEFPRAKDSSDATMDSTHISLLPANLPAHETAEKDAAALDDGDAGYDGPSPSFLRFAS